MAIASLLLALKQTILCSNKTEKFAAQYIAYVFKITGVTMYAFYLRAFFLLRERTQAPDYRTTHEEMIISSWIIREYSEKILVLLCRSRTYDLPITSSDA